MMVLSAIPNIEIVCTDSCECFDDNKNYLRGRLEEETNPKVRSVMSTALSRSDRICGNSNGNLECIGK